MGTTKVTLQVGHLSVPGIVNLDREAMPEKKSTSTADDRGRRSTVLLIERFA